MKNLISFLVLLFFFFEGNTQQTLKSNGFIIGNLTPQRIMYQGNVAYGCSNVLTEINPTVPSTACGSSTCPTSFFNRHKLDGYNAIMSYIPKGWWAGENDYKNFVTLVKNNNMKTVVWAEDWFVPYGTGSGNGFNLYNNDMTGHGCTNLSDYNNSNNLTKARVNYDLMQQIVFNDATIKDWIWVLHVSGEPSCLHLFNTRLRSIVS